MENKLIMPISKWLGEDLVAKGFPITNKLNKILYYAVLF